MKNKNQNKNENKSSKYSNNLSKYTNQTLGNETRIETDPLGSWTGIPEDPYDMPIQDADDL